MAFARLAPQDPDMATPFAFETLDDVNAAGAAALDAPPMCGACTMEMHRSELRGVRRAGDHIAPSSLVFALPTWKCGQCGRQEPRLTE